MWPNQAIQLIAVADVGRIAAMAFANPEAHAGSTLEIAGDYAMGNGIAARMTAAAGRPISYARFPDAAFEADPFLARLAALVDAGPLAGSVDLLTLFTRYPACSRWMRGWRVRAGPRPRQPSRDVADARTSRRSRWEQVASDRPGGAI